ncbi:hypothetical protein ACJX0J_011238, partial [Zea mays]
MNNSAPLQNNHYILFWKLSKTESHQYKIHIPNGHVVIFFVIFWTTLLNFRYRIEIHKTIKMTGMRKWAHESLPGTKQIRDIKQFRYPEGHMLNCLIFMTKATCFGLLNSTVFYLNLASSSCIVLVLVPKRRKTKNPFTYQSFEAS